MKLSERPGIARSVGVPGQLHRARYGSSLGALLQSQFEPGT